VAFLVGAAYDLYTTKRAFDVGLREANPLLRPFANRRGGLAAVLVSKVAAWWILGRVGGDAADDGKVRVSLYVGVGVIQMGIGFANRSAIRRARDRGSAPGLPPVPSVGASIRP
jgi:hypothetical protein